MTYTKKYMTALWSLGLAMAVPVASHAFTSQGTIASTASVTVTGGAVSMAATIRNISDSAVAPAVGWTAAAGASWVLANQYIRIVSTVSIAGSGIQTYTNNTIASASPRYGLAASSTAAAGLINTSDTTRVIPLAWQIRAAGATPEAVDDPNQTGIGRTGWAWFYYADRAGGLMPNAPANSYIQPIRDGGVPQIQFAQTSFGDGAPSGINHLYLESLFTGASGGTTYKTSTLTLELFTP